MALFTYRAVAANGSIKSGRLPAVNERELESRLRLAGLELITARARPLDSSSRTGKVSRKDLINLCFHMEQTLRGGVPLTESLADLIEGSDQSPLRNVLTVILDLVTDGKALSVAMGDFPNVFDGVFIGLIRAGEEAGTLPETFAKLGSNLRWMDELHAKVVKMLLYPSFTFLVLVAVTFFMLIFLVPQLANFIQSAVKELPMQTQVLLALSQFTVKYWGAMLLTPGLVLILITVMLRYASPAVLLRLDRWKFRLPLVGVVIEKVALARFTALLAMLYASGVPILRSLEVCQAAAGNRYLAQGLGALREDILGGKPLSAAFSDAGLFPNLVLRMIRIGESTGEIDRALENVSYFFHREIQDRIEKIQVMIEPILTVSLGLLLGWLMMSVLGPIYDILGKLKV